MNFKLKIWRQKNSKDKGRFVDYTIENVADDTSFLEMLDILNEKLISNNEDPVAFDHDCREGICGTCSLHINGRPHGPKPKVTACQLFMRTFRDGEQITIEPWRAKSFPVIRDLITDRSSFERIIQAGGFISASTGSAPDGNAIPVPKADAEWAMDAAACIGCGACVAACKNASAMLFVSAKVAHLGKLPQGKVEAKKRVLNMIAQMDKEGFGSCTNTYACEAECPKGISVANIAYLNREYLKAGLS